MKLNTHLILQALMMIVQYGTVFTTMIPAKYQPFLVLLVSAAQGALAWWNHYYTPAGQKIV